mmetsp:Transcript_94597/g.305983  ORF Transcript_94597/g.305983 Transcript_94597/m.305983 type:complete len:207 (+) Transcript_94597:1558-2178(+)
MGEEPTSRSARRKPMSTARTRRMAITKATTPCFSAESSSGKSRSWPSSTPRLAPGSAKARLSTAPWGTERQWPTPTGSSLCRRRHRSILNTLSSTSACTGDRGSVGFGTSRVLQPMKTTTTTTTRRMHQRRPRQRRRHHRQTPAPLPWPRSCCHGHHRAGIGRGPADVAAAAVATVEEDVQQVLRPRQLPLQHLRALAASQRRFSP